jgi:ABC-type multidrug transport system ATPase subunit
MNVNNLCYKHNKSCPYFFKDLSFQLEPGKIHALHGKNGTGKSVLLGLLNGKMAPQGVKEGEIKPHGKTLLVNQRFDQLIADTFSFDENLRFACMGRYPSLMKSLRQPLHGNDFINQFHIDVTKPVYMLSGGQRQILALLMTLQKPVDILLLDEPTATLDEENAVLVFEFLKALSEQGITIIVICHDRELVGRYVSGQNIFLGKKYSLMVTE